MEKTGGEFRLTLAPIFPSLFGGTPNAEFPQFPVPRIFGDVCPQVKDIFQKSCPAIIPESLTWPTLRRSSPFPGFPQPLIFQEFFRIRRPQPKKSP
jgi:hypothetical protein